MAAPHRTHRLQRTHLTGTPGSPWSEGGGTPRALLRSDGSGARAWLRFEDPVEVLRADRVDQVPGVLARVEEGTGSGLWAVGFVTYEAAPAFDSAFRTHPPSPHLPLAWFGLFGPPSAVDPAPSSEEAPLVRDLTPTLTDPAYLAAVRSVREQIARGETYQANLTYRLLGRLPGRPEARAAEREALSFALFRHLAHRQEGPYAGFLELGDLAICSASPELFFERSGRSVVCRPMKGTAPRGATSAADRAAAEELRASPKERAENLMIVDMIRNDLGRVARAGSVAVRELFRVERYPTLFQMTSEVEATTDAPLSALFQALFPCASITGAPKVRTMEILSTLETTPRGIYTGALGFVAPGGDARFSVAIRTALVRADGDGPGLALEYGTGSGIVWDSIPERELEETRTKALILQDLGEADRRPIAAQAAGALPAREDPGFRLLETLLWRPPAARCDSLESAAAIEPVASALSVESDQGVAPERVEDGACEAPFCLPPGGGFVLLERHLERLARSAEELGFGFSRGVVRQRVEEVDRRLASTPRATAPMEQTEPTELTEPIEYRVRLLVDREGRVSTDEVPWRASSSASTRPWTLALATAPVDGADPLLRHKTTRRAIYEEALERARLDAPDAEDVILWNRDGEITETTIANLVVELDGEWLTPDLACGLLPGTFRAELLSRGVVREARLPRAALERATRIVLVNSVRGWISCRLVSRSRHSMPRHGKAG